MDWLKNLVRVMCFRILALRALADRQAIIAGLICYIVGCMANALMRSFALTGGFSGDWIHALWELSLVQWLLFPLFVYIPILVSLSNAFSDDGLGLSFSTTEYRTHIAVLLPVWGVISLITAPLQLLSPRFLSILQYGEEILGDIHMVYLVRPLLLAVYSFWVVMRLNYLSPTRTCGVFALSMVVLPIFGFIASFLFSLPLLLLIPLIYFGLGWIRSQGVIRTGAGDLQRNLQTLTVNPQDADAHYQLGLIHLNRGNVNSAGDYFETAVQISPEVAEYQYYLGRACERRGDWSSALKCYEETYRLDPEYGQGDIFREVGKAYLNTDSVEKGKEFLNFFLSRRGADPEGRYWLAVALQKLGDVEGMRLQLNRIVEQARSNPRFFRRQNREWIYRTRNLLRETK